MDAHGALYYGSNEHNQLRSMNVATLETSVVFSDDVQNIWIDTLAFSKTSVVWTTNELPFFFAHNTTAPVFRIWSRDIGVGSYLTGKSVPKVPPCESK
jgi:hypothetical protein